MTSIAPRSKVRVAVTGLGAVSALGRGVEALWTGLCQGRRGVRPAPEGLPPPGIEVGPLGLFTALPLDTHDRAGRHGLDAALEALADGKLPPRRAPMALSIGTTLGGIEAWLRGIRRPDGVSRFGYPGPAHQLADVLSIGGCVEAHSSACASGNAAIGAGFELIRSGRAEIVLAGGLDALQEFVVSGFACLKALDPRPCRPFDRDRKGLNLGEGAAFLVLESEAHAEARGARPRAFVDGYGVASDAVHMTGPDREGRGAARAMAAALARAGVAPEDVGFVSAHGTATPYNDLMEARALELVLGSRAHTTPTNSIKGSLGHTLGAAGALEAVMCVRAIEEGVVPATVGHTEADPEIPLDIVRDHPRALRLRHALSTSSGFGGVNAALLFSAGAAP